MPSNLWVCPPGRYHQNPAVCGLSQHLEPRAKMLHGPYPGSEGAQLVKGESGGSWPAPLLRGGGEQGRDRGMRARQIPAFCHTRGHTNGAPNLLG